MKSIFTNRRGRVELIILKRLPISSGNLNFQFLLRCHVRVKQQNKKAIQLLSHLCEILTCNLQPAVYIVRLTSLAQPELPIILDVTFTCEPGIQ